MLCNSGVIFARVDWLFELLEGLSPNNSQNEYYLTDIFSASSGKGEPAYVFETIAAAEFAGVNDRKQLAAIEQSMLSQRLDELMAHGVTLHKPETIYIEAEVVVEPDVVIFPGACLRGASRVARHCIIGPAAYLEDTTLGAGVQVGAHAVLIRSKVAAEERISPQVSYADAEL
jgi:bifunctional UDP-N-acetylglucosamine pyrophosphorylase/glucosamine-1-phosphate N-acetyltransferase